MVTLLTRVTTLHSTRNRFVVVPHWTGRGIVVSAHAKDSELKEKEESLIRVHASEFEFYSMR